MNSFVDSKNDQKVGSISDDYSKNKTLDEILDLSLFPFLDSQLADKIRLKKSIRLLYIFGASGQNVLFVTNDDICYAFGNNTYGCLAMGNNKPITTDLKINSHLSERQLFDICCGVEHCLALTTKGQCYSWGHNHTGQLGVELKKKTCYTPLLIRGLTHKKVIQICCGAYHSMALTDDGQIYSWGLNRFGQLGLDHYESVWKPTLMKFKFPFKSLPRALSISCGRNHSLVLTDDGSVYMCGFNEFGQLGKHKEHQLKERQLISNPYLNGKNGILYEKGVCGPDHTFLLSTNGLIFGFGENASGQIGDGSTSTQYFPVRINDKIRFKDIIATRESKLTIGVSTDNKYYVWGSADRNVVLSPKLVSNDESIFNIYAKLASKKTTFKTIVINEFSDRFKSEATKSLSQKTKVCDNSSDASIRGDVQKNSFPKQNASELSTVCDNHSIRSSLVSSNPSNNLQNHMIQSFNNPKNSDLMFISEDKIIYCHKTILQIRNEKFWGLISKQLSDDPNEITVTREYFDSFYAFLQYLYGIEPFFDHKIVYELQAMAEVFDEKDLLDECSQYIEALENTPNLSNVCTLYRKAIIDGSNDLQSSCVEFVANNWKPVLKSDDFHAIDDILEKRLLLTVLVIDL